MSSSGADGNRFSLRGRLVLLSALSTGVLAALLTAIVTVVSYRYLIGDVDAKLDRLATDLQREYVELGGATPAFFHCVDEDAEEHNAKVTFLLVTDAAGEVVKETPVPVGYRRRLLHMVANGRFAGRFYTERADVRHEDHGAVRFCSRPLDGGGRVIIARDVTVMERYLIFLLATLAGGAVLIAFLSGLSGYLIGGRILKLNQLVAEKDRAYGELRRLTDDIAHDLRTPLTRLAMAAETEASGGALAEPLGMQVMDETHQMLELINTMLEISQTEAKIDRTPREALDLAAFVRHAGDLYSAVAEDASIAFSVSVPDRPVHFAGHKGKLQQLLGNLVENAFKFTPKGGSVAVSLQASSGEIRLSVSDTGCGISAADLPHVFTRFWRADSSRHLAGNGLGLALVRAIVTSYGGKVTCTSEVDRGTTFTVVLRPLCPSDGTSA